MEIGSNFELNMSNLENTNDTIFNYLKSYQTVYTDSGRSALRIINQFLIKGVILLPSYLCSSITSVYQEKFKIHFYKVNKDFTIDLDDFKEKLNEQVSAVYIIHYFGRLQEKNFLNLLYENKQKYGFSIIEDTTHSIFTKNMTIGDFCICSLRKWFPIPDGGVLYSKKPFSNLNTKSIPIKAPSEVLEAMILKKWHIRGKINCNDLYRKIFIEQEKKLDNQNQMFHISEISKGLLECYSISQMIKTRKANYHVLDNFLKSNGINPVLKDTDFVPLALPIYIKNRDKFRRYLSDNHVYCAVHWPLKNTGLENCTEAVTINNNIISLPIDQRYDKKHMGYLQELIKKYIDKTGENIGYNTNP